MSTTLSPILERDAVHPPARPAVTRLALAVALALALTPFTSACGDSESQEANVERAVNEAINRELGGGSIGIDGDGDGDEVTLTDGESTLVYGGREMPDGFPSQFPIIDPDLTPTVAMSLIDEGEQRVVLSYMLEITAAEVADWYGRELPGAGWTITEAYSPGGGVITFEGHGYTGGVAIFDQTEASTINIHLERPVS